MKHAMPVSRMPEKAFIAGSGLFDCLKDIISNPLGNICDLLLKGNGNGDDC